MLYNPTSERKLKQLLKLLILETDVSLPQMNQCRNNKPWTVLWLSFNKTMKILKNENCQVSCWNLNQQTDLEHKYPSDEDAEDVDNSEEKTECAEYGGFGRHVTTVHKLIVVVTQLSTVQRRVLYHLQHTHRLSSMHPSTNPPTHQPSISNEITWRDVTDSDLRSLQVCKEDIQYHSRWRRFTVVYQTHIGNTWWLTVMTLSDWQCWHSVTDNGDM